MTEAIFVLPGAERSTLSCVWIATGNPAQPLACVWVDRDLSIAAQEDEDQQFQEQALCA
jgi:hypothetical protein